MYANKGDLQVVVKTARMGLPAGLVRRLVVYGLQTDIADEVSSCATVVFAFVFQCRAVSVAYLQDRDTTITASAVTAVLTQRKGRARQRPLRLSLPTNL